MWCEILFEDLSVDIVSQSPQRSNHVKPTNMLLTGPEMMTSNHHAHIVAD